MVVIHMRTGMNAGMIPVSVPRMYPAAWAGVRSLVSNVVWLSMRTKRAQIQAPGNGKPGSANRVFLTLLFQKKPPGGMEKAFVEFFAGGVRMGA